MASIKLFSVPAPGQCIENEDVFLGTVRIKMHKASIIAIATCLIDFIQKNELRANVEIVDMQDSRSSIIPYGEINYTGLKLIKYRVGQDFGKVNGHILEADIIGISINYTHSRIIVRDFIHHVKTINKNAIIIIGGTEATAVPYYYLNQGADIVVRGEGEKIIENIVYNYIKGLDLYNVPGTYCNKQSSYIDNNTKINRNGSMNINDVLPQKLSIVKFNEYTDTGEGSAPSGVYSPFISVETSRGCAQACSFCATPFMQGRYRFMTAKTIIKHLEYYKDLGITSLLFQEDNILSRIHRNYNTGDYVYPDGKNELLTIFAAAKYLEFAWEFSNGLEFGLFEYNGVIDYELINAMFWNDKKGGKQIGCYRATIPLENLSEVNYKLFRKLKPFNKGKSIISAISETNVYMLNFNLIIGRPEDDLNIVKLSYDRCIEVKEMLYEGGSSTVPFFNVYNLSLLPGTVDYRKFRGLVAFDLEKDPEVVTFYLGSLNTQYFSAFEATKARGSLAMKLNGGELIKDVDETRYITDQRFLSILN